MRAALLTVAVIVPLCLAAASAHADDGALIGTGIGAAVGGVVGSQIGRGGGQDAAIGVGVVAGGIAGHEIGQSVDNADRPSYTTDSASAFYESGSYDSNQPVLNGPYVPNYVAPPAAAATYHPTTESYCRAFSQQIIIDGMTRESYGTACLQPDGTWHTVQ